MSEAISELFSWKFLILSCIAGVILSIAANMLTPCVERRLRRANWRKVRDDLFAYWFLMVVAGMGLAIVGTKLLGWNESKVVPILLAPMGITIVLGAITAPMWIKSDPNYDGGIAWKLLAWLGPGIAGAIAFFWITDKLR